MDAWTRDGTDVETGTWRPLAFLDGVETVVGTAHADKLMGNAESNTFLYASDGVGTGGLDQIDGRDGADTADFSDADFGVWLISVIPA